MNANEPAYIRSSPPKNSNASLWCLVSTDQNLFNISFGANSIVEVEFSAYINNTGAASTFFAITGTPASGIVYSLALDRITTASPLLIPVNMATTV